MLSTEDEWTTEEEIQVICSTQSHHLVRFSLGLLLCLWFYQKAVIIFCFQLFLALHGLRPVGINKVSYLRYD